MRFEAGEKETYHPNMENATPSLCIRQLNPSDHGAGFSRGPAPSLHSGCFLETSNPVHKDTIQNFALSTRKVKATFFPDGGGIRESELLIANTQDMMNVKLRKDYARIFHVSGCMSKNASPSRPE